jgi:parallel beta-helix repeat protein
LKDITATAVTTGLSGYAYLIPASKNIKLTVPAGQDITITAAAGNFSLFSVSNASSSLTLGPTTGSGTLTLSGGTAAFAENRRGVYVNGSGRTFVLNDGVTITGFNGSCGVYLIDYGTFTMNGGEIRGNTASSGMGSSIGGGVCFINNGTFTMNGGKISGNTNSSSGGGVYFSGNGTFTMNGGEISGNTARNGGGVYVYNSGTFNMYGGEISGNTATFNGGGGVYVYAGTFRVGKTAVVSGNIKTGDSSNNNVYLSGTNVITLGTNANAPAQGMEIHVQTERADGVIVSSGATAAMTGYFVPDEAGKTMTHLSGQLFIGVPATGVTLNKTTASIAAGAQETLTAAVAPPNAINKTVTWSTSDAAIATVSGGTVTAESAGTAVITATADGGYTATCAVTVFTPEARITSTGVEYPTLTAAITAAANGTLAAPTEIVILNDITVSSGYTIPINKHIKLTVPDGKDYTITAAAGNYRLFSVTSANSSLTLGPTTGGGKLTLSGNNEAAAANRMGVYVSGSGITFVLNDGVTITGFKNSNSGGGVYIANATFNMNGGSISGNTSTGFGGGVHVGGNVTFTMSGGTISGNTASNGGGGVYAQDSAVFTMSGGTILGNSATDTFPNGKGGGVYVTNGNFTMINGTISGNTTSTNGGGVYVDNNAVFTMSGGEIAGNSATGTGANGKGGGVYVRYGTLTMSGGTIFGTNDTVKTNIANGSAPKGVAVYLGSDATAKYGNGDDIVTGADTGIDTTVTGHN